MKFYKHIGDPTVYQDLGDGKSRAFKTWEEFKLAGGLAQSIELRAAAKKVSIEQIRVNLEKLCQQLDKNY